MNKDERTITLNLQVKRLEDRIWGIEIGLGFLVASLWLLPLAYGWTS